MKKHGSYCKMSAGLAMAMAAWLGGLSAAQAAATPLNGYFTLRPLSHTEINNTNYNLLSPKAQFSGGLTTVGIGEPAYLEALANISLNKATITNCTFTLMSAPAGSSAFIAPSPLGA